MRLYLLEVEGYKSFKDKATLRCDDNVTVVLGANDHGKTNLLDAIELLNKDKAATFNAREDTNDDRQNDSEKFPLLQYTFQFTDEEFAHLSKILEKCFNIKSAEDAMDSADDAYTDALTEKKSFIDRLPEIESKLENIKISLDAVQNELSQDLENSEKKEEVSQLLNSLKILEGERSDLQKDIKTSEKNIPSLLKKYQIHAVHFFKTLHQYDEEFEGVDNLITVVDQFANTHKKAIKKQDFLSRELEAATDELSTATSAGDQEAIDAAQKKKKKKKKDLRFWKDRAVNSKYYLANVKEAKNYMGSDDYKSYNKPKVEIEELPTEPPTYTVKLCGSKLKRTATFSDGSFDHEEIHKYANERLPRIEKIIPPDHLPSSIKEENYDNDEICFMRGILYYAGLRQSDFPAIFSKNLVTVKKLREAQSTLNDAIKQAWLQGADLGFNLTHGQEEKNIELSLSDPSIESTYARVSKRSSGFTQFFGIKTIQYAKQVEAQANSYIWLFDEPGLHLHPSGQRDLLKVFEALSKTNQLLYSTHSMFLINNNFPTRHRLVEKEKTGTTVVTKPYVNQWGRAIDSLGLSLPGTILFGNKVLLVEGVTDTILLNKLLQLCIQYGNVDADINPLSIIDFGNDEEAISLIKVLSHSHIKPTISVLFDGDSGGKNHQKNLSETIKSHKIEQHILEDGMEIEDYMPFFEEAHIPAMASYICEFFTKLKEEEVQKSLQESYKEKFKKVTEVKGYIDWAESAFMEITKGNKERFSKTDYSRHYVDKLEEYTESSNGQVEFPKYTMDLVKWVVGSLDLKPLSIDESKIREGNS